MCSTKYIIQFVIIVKSLRSTFETVFVIIIIAAIITIIIALQCI